MQSLGAQKSVAYAFSTIISFSLSVVTALELYPHREDNSLTLYKTLVSEMSAFGIS